MKSQFLNPPAAFRGKPFWSWNSKLEIPELLRQLAVFDEMGMGGAFMHSRTGLATPYLGKDWMKSVEACTRDAAKRGMESWIYDEDRWPSGAAGGLVTSDPKYRMRYLRCSIVGPDEFRWPESDFVAAFIAEIDGINLASYRPLVRTVETPQLNRGEKFVLFTHEPVQTHKFFNDAAYLATMDPKAVEKFIHVTHERYAKAVGRQFGKTIPGIFTDEPHHGFVMADTPKGWVYPLNSGWATPWTEALPGYFRKRFGYDLRARLPELFLRLRGERFSPLKWQYMEAIHSVFVESFAKQIGEWCGNHNLMFTGHVLAEDLPGSMSVTNGSVQRFYEHMQAPGMDMLNLYDRSYWTAKQVASTARQFGKKWVLSELYGCTGWQMDFAGHKRIGDWQAFLGVNVRCHHLAWYSMAGESKRDYPASISFQSPWYREYRAIEEYFARIGLLMQRGKSACDILVLHPAESVWAQIFARWATWIKNQSPEIAPIDDQFKQLCRWILGAQLDYDYGDEDQLARLGRVEKDARLRLGQSSYRTVVVAGMETIRSSTIAMLKKFQQVGGKVIFAGKPPGYMDAVASAEPTDLSRNSIRVPFQRAAIAKALHAVAPPLVEVIGVDSPHVETPVLLQVRKDGDAWTLALCNTSDKRAYPKVTVTFNGPGAQVQDWDCRTGEVFEQPFRKAAGALRWEIKLPVLGERVFRVVAKADRQLKSAPKIPTGSAHKISGPFAYELDEPNALVLDRFEWRGGKGAWQPETDILVIDDQLRDKIGISRRTGAMVQPWARKKPARAATLSAELRTTFHVRDLPESLLHLVVEQAAQWKIRINGKPVEARENGWHIDPCMRKIPIHPQMLKKGENTLELATTFLQELNLEAIYLIGNFAVHGADTRQPWLGTLPAKLKLGDVCNQGLPFYSGRIRYTFPLPKGARALKLPSFGGAVARIEAAGEKPQLLAFPPHVATFKGTPNTATIDLILTRRNLFGPLHLVPKEQFHYGPATFRSVVAEYHAGQKSTTSYSIIPQFFPAGLLAAPEVVTRA